MKKEDSFIKALSENAGPINPVKSSRISTVLWLISALAVLCLMVYLNGLRHDIGLKLHEPLFVAKSVGLLLLAGVVAFAGFQLGIPDAPKKQRVFVSLVYGGLVFWAGMLLHSVYTLGPGHMTDHAAHTLHVGDICMVSTISGALAAATVMFIMLRHHFAVKPAATAAAVAVSSGTIAYMSGMYFCPIENGLHIAVWHMGPALISALVLSFVGAFILRK